MIWSAERWVVNEVGRIHWASFEFEASGWPEAEALCILNGWRRLGRLLEIIDAPEMDGFTSNVVDSRDREWLSGGRNRIVGF